MTTIAHYPGPWYVGERSAGHGIDIRAESSKTLIAQVSVGLMANGGNARVIAAAPELLAALKIARVYVEEYACGKPTAALMTVDAAIEKAEGR